MSDSIKIDVSSIKSFFQNLGVAGKEFKKDFEVWLEGIAMEFLSIVQDEIIRTQTIDTSLLLGSFQKGESENIWISSNNGFTLEVGTNLEYASYANDGHWTCEKGEIGRWIPGIWNGNKFTYSPNAKTGMYLKQQWVEGSHYYDTAFEILSKMFPKLMDAKLEKWISEYWS